MTQGESWGGYPKAAQTFRNVRDRHAALSLPPDGTALAFGNGRSYGDVCLNDGGTLLGMRGLDRFISFDAETGVLECEAGVLLADIIDIALPKGWFLPVTPGTKFVTVGGAIANDVHGKNHHREGTFGRHVLAFELLRSDGGRRVCSAGENADLFATTIGGLGLTGVVTWARLQLKRMGSAFLAGEQIKFGGLNEFFALSEASAATHEYVVSWIDCLARGASLGRGLFMRANALSADEAAARGAKAPIVLPLAMPLTPPISLVNGLTLRAFNAAYFYRQRTREAARLWHYGAFHYPLDAISNWNRIYGPKGFLQYQCVVPARDQRAVSEALLKEISRSGQGSFLVVFKVFGETTSPGLLSFPMAGTTLALDFPIKGATTFALLDRLDAIVCEAGGRIYPAKDARMSVETFRRGYPRLEEFRKFVDPRLGSSFARRVMGTA
ncbi:MAG: FAD-binding oxidoreductase [Parvibaculum sp.]|uniref:FAD-binding oxidoreductase n=1 Tax=Parvibaculum sp. TaxID=2024848 RepID=UPI002845D0C3|nr:FAD-binding oxidoreductase [Parvibaculum sp.]MDR3499381.1 FAD-binding oxidoreductase [Parvibaculum sp.]